MKYRNRQRPTPAPPEILPAVYSYTYAQPNPPAPVKPKKSRKKRIIKIILMLVVLTIGWFGWTFYDNIARLTGNRNPLQILNSFRQVDLKQTDGRTNILLTGYSTDDPGHQGSELTDSIMIISVNKDTKQAALISIPRDLWVRIPGHGYSKINAAYTYGKDGNFNEPGYFEGGMGLLQKVLQDNLGLDLHYYALINYSAVRDGVDAVGGVTVDLRSDDNPYGLYDPYANLKLPNDIVTLDGQQALNLTRARGSGPGAYGFPRGDFNRTEHQRQVLVALKDKATSPGVIANPLKLTQLVGAVGDNVRTSLNTAEIQTLFTISKTIPSQSITSAGLNDLNDRNYLKSYNANGQSALIPATGINNYDSIQAALLELLSPPTPTTGSESSQTE